MSQSVKSEMHVLTRHLFRLSLSPLLFMPFAEVRLPQDVVAPRSILDLSEKLLLTSGIYLPGECLWCVVFVVVFSYDCVCRCASAAMTWRRQQP